MASRESSLSDVEDEPERDGPVYYKAMEDYDREDAGRAYAYRREQERKAKEDGTAQPPVILQDIYFYIVLDRAQQYNQAIDRDDMETILKIVDDKHGYARAVYEAVDYLAEQIDLEHTNWREPEDPMAQTSKVLELRQRRMKAFREGRLTGRALQNFHTAHKHKAVVRQEYDWTKLHKAHRKYSARSLLAQFVALLMGLLQVGLLLVYAHWRH